MLALKVTCQERGIIPRTEFHVWRIVEGAIKMSDINYATTFHQPKLLHSHTLHTLYTHEHERTSPDVLVLRCATD